MAWLRLALALWASALLVSSFGQQNADGVLFLHLRRDADGISLLRASSATGTIRPATGQHSLSFEVTDAAGNVVYSGTTADPLLEAIEFPDPLDPKQMRLAPRVGGRAEFILRLPSSCAGGLLKFYRGMSPAPFTVNSRALISEIQLPNTIPSSTQRLRAASSGASLHPLVTNGPTATRLNIVLLAEGFRAGQLSTFTNRALAVAQSFLGTSPYSAYRDHFNAFGIFVPSIETGSDHPDSNSYRNTYFNSSYGTGGLVRLITIPPNEWNLNYQDGQGKVYDLLERFVPEYDIVLLLVNDEEYGGSGGAIAVASVHEQSAELALHEIGHSFAGLGDEYSTPNPGFPDREAANTTRQTVREMIKWKDWILPSTPIPTPPASAYEEVVGLFEGAHFQERDWFRPKLNCRMRTLGEEFCEVCKEAIVLAAYSKLNMISDSSPGGTNISVGHASEVTLRLGTVAPVDLPLQYTWVVNGATNLSYTSNFFPASLQTLGPGESIVEAFVTDSTTLVRKDPLSLLEASRTWRVDVRTNLNEPPVIFDISGFIVGAGNPATVRFKVSDPDSAVESIAVTASSGNTNLISNADMSLHGTGTDRTLTIETECGRTGSTTLTLFATDGANVVSNQFTFSIVEFVTPITIQPIPDQTFFGGSLNIPLQITHLGCRPLSVTASSSNADLLPNSNLDVQNSGLGWNLRMETVPSKSGSSTITVQATDGQLVGTTSFDLNIAEQPVVRATQVVLTSRGLLLRFSCTPAATMVLESSTDLRTWNAVIQFLDSDSFEYFIPTVALADRAMFRVRVLPF